MKMDEAIPSWDLLVSMDRSDRDASVCYLDCVNGQVEEVKVSLAPEEMEVWWKQVEGRGRRVAVAFEQPAPNLLAFFGHREVAAIYALNPLATFNYRRSQKVSHARTDESDAYHQALFVQHHRRDLPVWSAPPSTVVQLDRLNIGRRRSVEERTALTNRLQALLKRYYPQAIDLMHEDIWRPMNLEFLRKWPCPSKLRNTPLSRLRCFYLKHRSRSEDRWNERRDLINRLVPLAEATAADKLDLLALIGQIEALNVAVARYDEAIKDLFAKEGAKAEHVASLPGAGPTLAPRIYVALAKYAPRCPSPEHLAAAVGVAPVTDQSGKMKRVYRRRQCDNYTRQSFVEWATETWKYSTWARAFVKGRQERGQSYHAIMRALAYKWIRILWKCWHQGYAYNEARYLERLRAKGSHLAPPIETALQKL